MYNLTIWHKQKCSKHRYKQTNDQIRKREKYGLVVLGTFQGKQQALDTIASSLLNLILELIKQPKQGQSVLHTFQELRETDKELAGEINRTLSITRKGITEYYKQSPGSVLPKAA